MALVTSSLTISSVVKTSPSSPQACSRRVVRERAVATAAGSAGGSHSVTEGWTRAWAAQRIATHFDVNPGVVGPTAAFGLERLRHACAKLGLVTV
ncbi:hypothetical protein ACFCWG_18220 [Streptomyces sp. NPDC056390]|uniref:hypothetical protein n=1 Tax=Streptomyces sp. NPDC056390 TaxID=3345806 RepID=UPI0035DB8401